VRIVDSEGRTVATGGPGSLVQYVRFRPDPHGVSRFTFPEAAAGKGAASIEGAVVMAPDQKRYTMELYPLEGTDLSQPYELGLVYHECSDRDGDGYGLPGEVVCPAGAEPDCDDADPARHPGGAEVCDGLDNDCDAAVDEGLSSDADGDGPFTPPSCAAPRDDCDDADPSVHPGAPEACDN
jgi:hypothetical protein